MFFVVISFSIIRFYTTLKPNKAVTWNVTVLVSYDFTLLSNYLYGTGCRNVVLVSYDFTLLSNI